MPWEFHGNRRVSFMARTAHPWFWDERNGWYVNKDGQRHFLGEHPADAPLPRKVKGKWYIPPPIAQAFHTLMANQQPIAAVSIPNSTGPSIVEILDKFLGWCQKH